MMMQHCKQWIGTGWLLSVLVGVPCVAMAADNDLDGIDDTIETTGNITFGGVTYSPCVAGVARNACLSPTSKDIFIYVVRSSSGFLATNGLDNAGFLFEFITQPKTTTARGKVDGLGVGVHAAFVTAEVPTGSRYVGATDQKAVQIIADDLANSPVFGKADVGTPTDTGDATIYPLTIKNYVNALKGGDNTADWQKYIKQTFSHELSHMTALFATYNSRYGGYHTKSGTGVVMDQEVVYNSNNKTFAIPTDYASGDNPCLLRVDTSNPLNCIGFIIVD